MLIMTGMLTRQGSRETLSPNLQGRNLKLSQLVNTKREFGVHTYHPSPISVKLSEWQPEIVPKLTC